jgi:VCBS repeat-containing protein
VRWWCRNDPPTAVVLSDDTVAENEPVSTLVGTLSATDPDPGDQHTFTLVVGTGSGDNEAFRISGSGLRTDEVFDVETNDSYSIRVRATDEEGAFVEQLFTITVVGVDDAPVAEDDTATVAEDDPATAVNVLANDTDIDAGPKTIDAVTQPDNGTVVVTGAGSGLTCQPDANHCNTQTGGTPDTFTYTLNGGSIGAVSVTVTCVDVTPLAVNDSATVAEGAPAMAADVLGNDTDIDGGPPGGHRRRRRAHL